MAWNVLSATHIEGSSGHVQIHQCDWDVASAATPADIAAGSARATLMQLLRTVLGVLPRVPAVKFFRPKSLQSKAAKTEMLEAIKSGGRRVDSVNMGRSAVFMLGSAAAASSMFVLHKKVRPSLNLVAPLRSLAFCKQQLALALMNTVL